MCVSAFFILSSNSGGYTSSEVASTAATSTGGCSCHGMANAGGQLQMVVKNSIDVPVQTYTHGNFYKVEITLFSGVANGEAGMQSTVQDQAGNPVGDISLLQPTQTRLDTSAGGKPFVSHNTDLVGPITTVSGSNQITVWEYTWVAPTTGSVNVDFYAVANDANGNSMASGDVVYRTNNTLTYEAPASVNDLEAAIQNMYPNPVSDNLNFRLGENIDGDVNVHVFSLNGQCLKRSVENGSTISIDLSDLNSGNYIISLENDGKTVTKPFTKI